MTAYLREERKKPKGERDLLREVCAMILLDIPKDRKVYFVVSSAKMVVEIVNSEVPIFCTQDHFISFILVQAR